MIFGYWRFCGRYPFTYSLKSVYIYIYIFYRYRRRVSYYSFASKTICKNDGKNAECKLRTRVQIGIIWLLSYTFFGCINMVDILTELVGVCACMWVTIYWSVWMFLRRQESFAYIQYIISLIYWTTLIQTHLNIEISKLELCMLARQFVSSLLECAFATPFNRDQVFRKNKKNEQSYHKMEWEKK